MQQERIWSIIAKKLSGEASPEELSELANLLRQQPEMHYPIQAISDLWESPAKEANQGLAIDAFAKMMSRMKQQGIPYSHLESSTEAGSALYLPDKPESKKAGRHVLLYWPLFAGLAILGILAIKTLIIPPNKTQQAPQDKNLSEISTRNGSKTHLVLPDGTIVWLNAGSKISYDKNFGNALREVSLTGEAFFDVVHNAEKPFIIHTSKIDIRVLGTRFNVKSYPADKTTEASLIRGSIEVSFHDRPNEKIILKPNEKIIVANYPEKLSDVPARPEKNADREQPIMAIHTLTHLPQSAGIAETSWVENKLTFQDESFRDLAKDMERWFGVSIRFDNSNRDTLHFTGSFENESVQQALEALKLTKAAADFHYNIRNNDILIGR